MGGARVLAGRYRLRERIGAGGMGEVWRATDEVLGRSVAVKLILPSLLDEPGFARRFLAEARAMASVRHPGVVAIHDFHADGTGAYLVMEFADGEPVSRALDRLGRLGPEATMDLVRQAALALQAVHDRGIVHRDVKPGNLLLRTDGTLALADFGIALGTANTSLTRSGAILGTPLYLAPEQVLGQAASPRSDVYALGVVAYECLTGRPPFTGDNPFAVAMQRVGQPPPPLGRGVPPAVAGVVGRALAADPALRWPSAAEFAAAAERAGASLPPGRHAGWPAATTISSRPGALAALPPPSPPSRPRPPHRPQHPQAGSGSGSGSGKGAGWGAAHSATAAAAAIVLLLVGAITLAVAIWGDSPSGPATPPGPASPAAGGTGVPGATPASTPASDGSTAGSQAGAGTGAGASGTEGTDDEVPDGLAQCGEALCPTRPMCWRGLVLSGDTPVPPAPEKCTEPHYWETFAVIELPADADTDYELSHLMDRPDVAESCSAEELAERSNDPEQTTGWRRDAWPVPTDAYQVLVHCLAGSDEGEMPGSAIQPG